MFFCAVWEQYAIVQGARAFAAWELDSQHLVLLFSSGFSMMKFVTTSFQLKTFKSCCSSVFGCKTPHNMLNQVSLGLSPVPVETDGNYIVQIRCRVLR